MGELFRAIVNLVSILAIPLLIIVFFGWGFAKKVMV